MKRDLKSTKWFLQGCPNVYFYQCSHWWRRQQNSFFAFVFYSDATNVSVCLYSFYIPPSFSRTPLWPHYEHVELSPARWTMGGGLGKEQQAEEIPHYKYRERQSCRSDWGGSGFQGRNTLYDLSLHTVAERSAFLFLSGSADSVLCWNLCRVSHGTCCWANRALPPVPFPSTGASFTSSRNLSTGCFLVSSLFQACQHPVWIYKRLPSFLHSSVFLYKICERCFFSGLRTKQPSGEITCLRNSNCCFCFSL